MRPGDRVVLTIGAVAHGGHCVARHEGQVVFVRHALPGETAEVLVTRSGKAGRFAYGDAVAVLTQSPDRVEPPCPHSGPARCGGCDWQHASLTAQRAMKTQVLREQLSRLGGLSHVVGVPIADAVDVLAVPGDTDGLGWRTRVGYAVAPDGQLGLRGHHSHQVEPVTHCRIAHPAVVSSGVTERRWPSYDEVSVTASSTGERVVVLDPEPATGDRRALRAAVDGLPADVGVVGARGRRWVSEEVGDRTWRVDAAGFWQVHPGAAATLVAAVQRMLAPRPGEHLLDLYCGVGLFAGALAEVLGAGGRVDAVESSGRAVRDARRNLHDLPAVHLHEDLVEHWLSGRNVTRCDLVVLDPPRSGAGPGVMRALAALAPRAVAYVACDPASLARDLRTAGELGFDVVALEAYDIFPMTHHFETVALLVPGPDMVGSGVFP